MFVKNKPDDNVVFYLRVASYIRMAKKSPHISKPKKNLSKRWTEQKKKHPQEANQSTNPLNYVCF